MRTITLLRILRWRPALIILPSLLRCLASNKLAAREWTDEDYLRFRDSWAQCLADTSQNKLDAMGMLYQDSLVRIGGLESKGIGVLQAVAIVAAGAFVALSGTGISILLAIFSLVYVMTAGIACGMALLPRKRYQLTIDDLRGDSTGYPEMAASIETMIPSGIRVSNLVTSGTEDLLRALVLTVAAIVAFLFLSHTAALSKRNVPNPSPSISVSRTGLPTSEPSARVPSTNPAPSPS